MQIVGLDHVSVIVSDLARARDFYQGVLGLKSVERPDLGFPGIWLDLGDGRTLHLMVLEDPCDGVSRPAHGGRDYHFALRVDDVARWAAHLQAKSVPFTKSRSGRPALFLRDPDENAIELFQI